MNLLLDQDVYAITARYLPAQGRDVVTAADLNSSQASDEALLRIAHQQGRLFVTRDRDFGGLVFVKDFAAGVIYLRSSPSIIPAVHEELERVLKLYSEADLRKAFVVVEPGRHRFRRLAE
jgi:predicted nuclease of predicted toxin-antitoxin system